MIRQARIVNCRHAGVAWQVLRDGRGVRFMLPHADRQRLDASQDQPGIERTQNGASGVLNKLQTRGLLLVSQDRDAPHTIAMSVEILGGGMYHNVRTQLQRFLEVWGEEGVVN